MSIVFRRYVYVMYTRLTNTGSQVHDTFRPLFDVSLLQPVSAIIVRAQKPSALHVLVLGHLGQRSLELRLGDVESEVVDRLLGVLKSLEDQVRFSKVAAENLVRGLPPPFHVCGDEG